MRLRPGSSYDWSEGGGSRGLTYLCLEECEAETERFKQRIPGYKLLVLDVRNRAFGSKPGDVLTVPFGSHITVNVRRLG